jgi:hypothetical protein
MSPTGCQGCGYPEVKVGNVDNTENLSQANKHVTQIFVKQTRQPHSCHKQKTCAKSYNNRTKGNNQKEILA